MILNNEAITLLGIGDVLIDRAQPETMFRHVADTLRSGDITYANCEGALSDKKDNPNPRQAANSDPRNLDAFLYAGVDVVSLANNHSLDWGIEGLLDTMERLDKANLPYFGAGKNLAEARQPVILERKGTKVGFLGYSSVHMDGYEATDDRPGLAQVRAYTIYEKVDYQPGAPPRVTTVPHPQDLITMLEDIKKLKTQVDVVIIAMHWGLHLAPRVIPMYCFDVGHMAIGAGADLILGTHTHILKGIEMYHGKAIFYSTSNFALELGPHMRDHKHIEDLDKLYNITDHTERKKTIIAKAVIEKKKIKKVSYIPCYINEQSEPEIKTRNDPEGQGVFDYMESISRSENLPVNFQWDGDEVLVMPGN
jgi:hypothetical protein